MIRRFFLASAFALGGLAFAGPKYASDMPARPLPFDILPRPTDAFSTEGRFAGTYRVFPGYIELNFEVASILVVGVPEHRKGRVVSDIKIGLGRYVSGQQWDKSNMVTVAAPDKIMQAGESIQLKPGTLRIPISDTLDLSKHWLLVEITNVHPNATKPDGMSSGTCFAHSKTNIFALAR